MGVSVWENKQKSWKGKALPEKGNDGFRSQAFGSGPQRVAENQERVRSLLDREVPAREGNPTEGVKVRGITHEPMKISGRRKVIRIRPQESMKKGQEWKEAPHENGGKP